jgi:hypothetical protein
MVKVIVTKNLEKEINKKFSKSESDKIFLMIYSLKENPFKGDIISSIGHIILKEIKYKKFRFYFIHSAGLLKLINLDDLKNELIKFIDMSDKSKEQQKVINKIKNDLKNFNIDLD